MERTEPDVHVIKEVESRLRKDRHSVSPGLRAWGSRDAVEILVFLIGNYHIGCYLAAKTAKSIQKGPGDLFAKGQSDHCRSRPRTSSTAARFFRDDLVEHAKLGVQTLSGQFLPCFASSFFSRLATPVAPRSRA